jgi:hypothetical protein
MAEGRVVFARCHCGRFVRVERVKINRFLSSIVAVAAVCSKHGSIRCTDYTVWP